jgi:iron complex transport system permease protein
MPSSLKFTLWLTACIGLITSYLLLSTGPLPWSVVVSEAGQRLTGATTSWNALLDERIPRLIILLCTGASLAAAGAIMQSLLQNPLAAPSILGVNAGSDLAVILTLITGWHHVYRWSIPIAAIAGALSVLLLLFTLVSTKRHHPLSDLLLMGIALSTLLLAIQSALLYAFRDHWQLIQTITEWGAGSTYDRNWQQVHMQLPLTIVGIALCWYYRHEANILALGESEALSLGVDVAKVRWRLILSVCLLTGGATAAIGNVPFFGLLVPHVLRYCYGTNHRLLLPLCFGIGAVTLTLFDTLLRITDIHFLTIGNLSALCGALFFILLLRRHRAFV